MRPPFVLVFGITCLAVLCANIAIAPGAEVLAGTYARLDTLGKGFAVSLTTGYVLLSLGVVFFLWRSARRRSREPSLRRDIRDWAGLTAIIGLGSLAPMALVALMREDSATSGPLINGATVGLISLLAGIIAIAFAIRSLRID